MHLPLKHISGKSTLHPALCAGWGGLGSAIIKFKSQCNNTNGTFSKAESSLSKANNVFSNAESKFSNRKHIFSSTNSSFSLTKYTFSKLQLRFAILQSPFFIRILVFHNQVL